MNVNENLSKLISKLTWETISGGVEWRFSSPPTQLTEGTSDVISTYISCIYKGQRIAVFERKFKYYTDVDEWSWTMVIVFALINPFGRVIFESPDADVQINNLFNVARDNASGIDSIISNLLSDD